MSRSEGRSTRPPVNPPPTRTRASEVAIRAALRAIQDAGLPVEKVCVNGGKVEIHCAPVEPAKPRENDKGLEKW